MALGLKFPSINFILKVAISYFIIMFLLRMFPQIGRTIGGVTGGSVTV